MSKLDFAKEVENSNLCPTNFKKIYKEFNYFQDKTYETLIEFHRVCEKNNIKYELAFGSLLGLIRDGGQIPWDYDADVIVPFSEREKLIKSLEKDLSNQYYYYCIENNKDCRHMIIRLAPIGFKSESLHVDVFFFCGTPNDEIERNVFCKKIEKLSQIRFYKKVNIIENSNGRIKRIIFLMANKIRYLLYSNKKVLKEYYCLCSKYNVFESDINVCADIFATTTQYETKYLWETILKSDENGNEFRIPKHYKEVLTSEYKNYKTIYPLENRLNEMIVHYKRLKKQNYIQNK